MVSLWHCGQFWDGVAFHVWTWTQCHTCHKEDRGWGGQLQCVSLDLSFGWQSFHSRDTATHCCQLFSLERPLDRQWLQGKNERFKALTLFGNGIDTIRLVKLDELLALVEGSQVPLKGSFGLELDRSLTIKARIRVSINVNALNMPEQILLSIVVYQTHCTLPVFNTTELFTNAFLLQEFSHPVLFHKHWNRKSFNSCVQSWRDVEGLFLF